MTEFSGANDKSDFDGNTLLLECQNNEYIFISGSEISKFDTDNKIRDDISLMRNKMCPHAIMAGACTYFIDHHYKFIENDKTEEGTLLNTTNNNLGPFLYHLAKWGKDSFKVLEHTQIHTFYPHNEEDVEDEDDVLVQEDEELIETNYTNWNNEVVKIFNQKCVICYERDGVFAFRQCGHQCICEDCYQCRGDIDLLKCVACRTQFFYYINGDII